MQGHTSMASLIHMGVDRSPTTARRSSRLSSRSDSLSSQSSMADPGISHTEVASRSNIRRPATKKTVPADGQGSELENNDDDNDEDVDGSSGDEDEGDDGDSEHDEIAPSGAPAKRRHQTGLSVSLSNTTLGKRGRSPDSDAELERPTSKMSRTSARTMTSEDEDGDDEDDNDDDVYNAIDDISESEEEGDVEELEEKLIIESEEEVDDGEDDDGDDEEREASESARRGSRSSNDSFLGLDDPEPESADAGSAHFFNELFPDASHTILQDEEDSTVPTTRRVRFAEEVELHSNSSTTDTDEDEDVIYPDLFLQQDSLDPTFRKLLEQKDQDDNRSSDGESYWDFENEDAVVDDGGDDGSVTESESSGYETDEGETTDEEILPPRTVSKPQTFLRQSSKSTSRPRSTQTPASTPVRKAPLTSMRRGPLMGSFLIDENKPIAVVDGHGKHMLFFPAPKHRRQAANGVVVSASPGPSAMTGLVPQSETESDVGFSQTDPMLSSPANVMMSGFNGTRANRSNSALSSEITGPPEAFFPFTNINSNGVIETDDFDDEDTYDEDYSDEDNLRIEDFINFGDDASSSDDNDETREADPTDSTNSATEDGKEQDADVTPKASRQKFPGIKSRQPTTPTSANTESLLDHFDKGVVSSFRRNNDRHKNWLRSPANIGIKGSRLHAVNAPISPLRRRRGGSMSAGVGRSPLRPQSSELSATDAGTGTKQEHRFGGPIKKRIQNSNHMRRRKNTL